MTPCHFLVTATLGLSPLCSYYWWYRSIPWQCKQMNVYPSTFTSQGPQKKKEGLSVDFTDLPIGTHMQEQTCVCVGMSDTHTESPYAFSDLNGWPPHCPSLACKKKKQTQGHTERGSALGNFGRIKGDQWSGLRHCSTTLHPQLCFIPVYFSISTSPYLAFCCFF